MSFKKISVILLALTSFLTYQNCSQSSDFQTGASGSENRSTSSFVELESGGDGYSGKEYELVNIDEQCPDPSINPSKIYIDEGGQAYLIVHNCETLDNPRLISVEFTNQADVIKYNGQYYQETTSQILFSPMSKTTVIGNFQVETMARVPTSGGGVVDEWLRITDNDYASDIFSFPETANYYLVVRAVGDTTVPGDAQMEIKMGERSLGVVEVSTLAGEYWFEVEIEQGDHEIQLHFINDYYNRETGDDRGLQIDYMIVAKKDEE